MPTRIQRERAGKLPIDEVITFYEAGKSTRQIALIFGVSFSTIQKKLRERGCIRSPNEANLLRYHGRTSWLIPYGQVEQLYNEGKTSEEVALLAGVAPNAIRAYLKKKGLLRSRSDAMQLAARQGKLWRASGEKHYKWKGGVQVKDGYVYVKVQNCLYRRRSHVIWEQHYGAVPEGFEIHHLNGVKDDDRIENLIALPKKVHGKMGNLFAQALQKRIVELEQLCRIKDGD